ncbi:MAG: hypothetical protein ACFE9M_08375 [Promethearchaeota archaeon]
MSEELTLLKKLIREDKQNLHGETLVQEQFFQVIGLILKEK